MNNQSKALQSFLSDLKDVTALLRKHWLAVSVSSIATLMLIIMQTPSLRYDFGNHGTNALLYYGVIPLITLVLLTRQSPLSLGLQLGKVRFWLPASLLYLAIALPITIASSQSISISGFYESDDFRWQQYIVSTVLYMLGWEYLYRGYLIFGLKKSLKEGAILVQMIPFTLLHLGKPEMEIISCIFSGLIWGYICYRGNSFWPAFLMHISVNFTIVGFTN